MTKTILTVFFWDKV